MEREGTLKHSAVEEAAVAGMAAGVNLVAVEAEAEEVEAGAAGVAMIKRMELILAIQLAGMMMRN